MTIAGQVRILPGEDPGQLDLRGTLDIASGGLLDVGNNDLVLLSSAGVAYETAREWIRSGQLTTTAVSPDPYHPVALAPVPNSLLLILTWNGRPISDGRISCCSSSGIHMWAM